MKAPSNEATKTDLARAARALNSWRRPSQTYEFIWLGAMDVTKPYKFIWFGAMDVTKP